MLERLKQAQLKLKFKKYRFAELEVEYLGHVSGRGLATDPRKIRGNSEVSSVPRVEFSPILSGISLLLSEVHSMFLQTRLTLVSVDQEGRSI